MDREEYRKEVDKAFWNTVFGLLLVVILIMAFLVVTALVGSAISGEVTCLSTALQNMVKI